MLAASPRQRDLLVVIRRWVREHGQPPSYRELADSLGVTSLNGVRDLVLAAERKGLLQRRPFTARALHLTEAGAREVGEP